jgi:long-chain fatty acid transport protein
MAMKMHIRLACVSAAAILSGLAVATEANAGAFGVREQSAYFEGSAFAGSAAGGDLSSMFWNSAATAELPGFNVEASATILLPSVDMTATGGAFVADPPAFGPVALPATANLGMDSLVPATYANYQLSDKWFLGLAINAPFGFTTKPDDRNWAGSPIGVTTKIFTLDLNPTVAYKITPTLTVGAGLQIEYFKITLLKGDYPPEVQTPLLGSRSYAADDWGVGATAGILWQPLPGTSVGLGYRSSVNIDVRGPYILGSSQVPNLPNGFATTANASLSLPDEVTLSVRQALTPQLTALATVEWQDWSQIGNVSAVSGACLPVVGSTACETLNLNYRDGWYFALGAEYQYSPSLKLRTGVSYEISPVTAGTRDTLVPDSDRIGLSLGGSYKWSDHLSIDLAYTHLFFDNAPFCVASNAGTGTTHCVPQSELVLLEGSADTSVDILSAGLTYKFDAPAPLETYKK